MKHKLLKSVVATFALVATLAVLPMASTSVEAAECDGTECPHETTILLERKDEGCSYISYSLHRHEYLETYECIDCGELLVFEVAEVEDHFDPDGDGMCECGTFYY